MTPGREPFGKREFLEEAQQPAGKVKISVQAEVKELPGDLGYCWLKLAVTVTPPNGGAPMYTLDLYRRDGGRWVPARDANLVV